MEKNVYSAIISSIIENILIHPIDVYKILYQQNKLSFKKYIRTPITFKYSGFIPRTLGNLPMRTTFWISQDIADNYFSKKNKIFNYTSIGIFTAFNQTLIDCPIENIKVSKINQFNLSLGNYYNGFKYHFYRNSIFAIFVYSFNKEGEKFGINKFLTGSLGGLLGSLISQPIDYLKTLNQSNNKIKFSDLLTNKYHYKNCMNGYLARASCGFMSMGIGSLSYNYIKNF